jgi:hypothetical protein
MAFLVTREPSLTLGPLECTLRSMNTIRHCRLCCSGVLALILAGCAHRSTGAGEPLPRGSDPSEWTIPAASETCPSPATDLLSLVSIKDVRLERDPATEPSSRIVRFEVTNQSSRPLADLVLQIALVERVARSPTRRLVAGPFDVRGKVVLGAQQSLSYAMEFRNVPSDCDCAAAVDVLSLRTLGGMPTRR